MEKIINNSEALPEIVKFLKLHFKCVTVISNKYSHLANISQNYYATILFESRGKKFSIKWNYAYCTLYFGDTTKNKKSVFQYTFTKIKLDKCYPVEEMNNNNVVFWSYELTEPFDEFSTEISPLRIPINKKK